MVKKNAEKDVGFVRQFNELKKKHPDSMLLFRKGDFYEMYKEDALKASVILALKVRYDEQHPEYPGLVMTDKNRWEYQQVVDKQSRERALKLHAPKTEQSKGLKL